MARAGHAYPQVEPGATALADGPVVTCAPTTRVAGARVVITGPAQAVRADELARAVEWGLGPRPVREVAWRELPVLPADASEIRARRRLLEGASLVLLRRAGRIVGVVDGERVDLAPPESSLQARLERAADRHAEARLWLLRSAGKIGEGMGTPVHAVGGFVRDLALGAESPDVDLVVEGDGVAFARCLGEEIGGTVLVHGGFGTASIEGGRAPAGAGIDGTTLGRVDVASARRERYPMAGALPDVSPAGLLEDLRRRDFSVNAMAMALAPDRFGHLVDPRGGQRDIHARRLRALRPLAFVEDPTRLFRAARYAARLGLRPDGPTRAGIALAVAGRSYVALSGQRLWREIELAAAEPRARQAFEHLVRWRVATLFGVSDVSRQSLADAERLRRWAKGAGIAVDPAELFMLALLGGSSPGAVARCLDRLALTGEPRANLEAGAMAGPVARRLAAPRLRPSAVDEILRSVPPTAALAAWLRGSARARRRVEWYLATGRAVQPRLTGGDLLALGVPRGPQVGRALAMLRRRRLDDGSGSVAGERELVKEWLTSGKEA